MPAGEAQALGVAVLGGYFLTEVQKGYQNGACRCGLPFPFIVSRSQDALRARNDKQVSAKRQAKITCRSDTHPEPTQSPAPPELDRSRSLAPSSRWTASLH